MESQLSPRLCQCLPADVSLRAPWATFLFGLGVRSVMDLTSWFDSAHDFASAVPDTSGFDESVAHSIYERENEISSRVLLAGARAQVHPTTQTLVGL